MTWAQYGLVQATDYNTMVGTNPTTATNVLNTVWATGGTKNGYGQSPLATVITGQSVSATEWGNVAAFTGLMGKTANCGSHQGSSLSSVVSAVVGGSVTYQANIQTNLNTIYSNKLNAATQGTTSSNTATYGSTWVNAITFVHTASFANGDAARYFFNSGGQLSLTCSHPAGTGINLLLNGLASNIGTLTMSAPTSETITVVGSSYTGLTRVGGGGTAPTVYVTGSGYFAQTITNANVYFQTASTGPSGYLGTFINVLTKSNGTQGSNGDAGSVITFYTVWDEIPNGLTVSSGSATTLTVKPPELTYLANTWGTITLAGSVSGS